MKLELIFEDDDLILVNKPTEMLTIPDRFDTSKPSVYGELNKIFGKVFIVHRLDRETSGIIVFAKNEAAHRHLSIQFEKHETAKIYLALLEGVMHQTEGDIDKSIGEHPSVPGKMAISKTGKSAQTSYKLVEQFKHFSLVEAQIKTGRTHQIRVHFKSIGYPLAVDPLYGRNTEIFLSEVKGRRFRIGKFEEERPIMSRTTLHAHKLTFRHPTTEEVVSFQSELPKDFSALVKQLQKWGK